MKTYQKNCVLQDAAATIVPTTDVVVSTRHAESIDGTRPLRIAVFACLGGEYLSGVFRRVRCGCIRCQARPFAELNVLPMTSVRFAEWVDASVT
jgi:hypothetical protein